MKIWIKKKKERKTTQHGLTLYTRRNQAEEEEK